MKRILIVDDSATSRAIASRLVGDLYEVETLGDGQAALDRAREGNLDLVLLDLLMPGMDGLAVLSGLRSGGLAVPVVFMTADVQDSTKERLLGLGASRIVNKPLTREKLVEALAAALGTGETR